jgi:hypothetical protein
VNRRSLAGEEWPILQDSQLHGSPTHTAGLDTGDPAAVHHKEAFCLPCSAYFVKIADRLHWEITEKDTHFGRREGMHPQRRAWSASGFR